jgi:hypothetical protein
MIRYRRPFSQIEVVAAFGAIMTFRCFSGMSADPLGFFHDSMDQPFPEAEASHFRRDIKALHLTTAVRLDGPKTNTTDRSAVGIVSAR